MRSLIRPLAVAALLAASPPWALVVTLVHHHAHENEGAPPAGLESGLHGHDHAAGTPSHEHPLMVGWATASMRAASFGLTIGWLPVAAFRVADVTRGEPGLPLARARNGPLRTAETVAILRV